ncbi:hypothetical protein [Parvularcula oceani]|uniref:hypothetical protein n=1 Tax=Parvularcula oceani TaxID=1247963 RepID=UPI00068ABA1A|nr:hypothetical protein [Parvularcula oceani]
MRFFGIVTAWLAASLAAYLLGSAASTQVTLAGIEALGRDVPLGVNLRTVLHDLGAMISYFAVIALGFAIAFYIASLVAAALPRLSPIAYPAAGGAAIATALALMTWRYGVTPILGAQEAYGFWLQVGAGVLGGLVFELFRPKPLRSR